MCGGVFSKERTDEEALQELESHFPGFTPDDCELACEGCYNEFMGDT